MPPSHDPVPWRGSCVGIGTCDRPDGIRDLLAGIARQDEARDLTVLVLDNGTHSSEAVVSCFRDTLDVRYERVAEAGLTPVRNGAVARARELGGRYLIFVDDDEVPEPGWLAALFARAHETGADIVSGPVRPVFEEPPPPWVVAGGFFDKSGAHPGTENLLLRLAILPEDPASWFREAFRETGGIDHDLLCRLRSAGASFAVAPGALVREHVPPARATLRYLLRMALRDGIREAQVALLDQPTGARVLAAGLATMASKVAYAAGNLVLATRDVVLLRDPRAALVCAVRDLVASAGCGLRLAGVRFRLYGRGVSQ